MTPEELLAATLRTIDGLADRVYPMGALKNAEAPFVFYLRQTQNEEDALDGATGLYAADFEVNCVANTYSALISLSATVRGVLRQMQGKEADGLLIERATVRQASPDLYEREVNLYRRIYILQINYQEVITDE